MNTQKSWFKGNFFVIFCLLLLSGVFLLTRNHFNVKATELVKQLDEKTSKELEENLSAEDKFIIYGDTTKASYELQQKALHEKFPTDKKLLANYINSLDFNKNSAEILKELDYAEKLDPQNALYNYYKAEILFSEACIKSDNRKRLSIKESDQREKDFLAGKYAKFSAEKNFDFKIVDNKKMKQAVDEFYKGLNKSHFETYIVELHNIRSHLKFGKIDSIAKQIAKLSFDGELELNYLKKLRFVTEAIIFNAQAELKKGNRTAAEKLFEAFPKFVLELNNDSCSLIESLVTIAIAKDFYYNGAIFNIEINDSVKANEFVKQYKKLEDFKKFDIRGSDEEKGYIKKVGYFGACLLPASVTAMSEDAMDKALKYERLMWYKYMDIMLNMQMFIYLIAIFLVIWIVALIARFRSPTEELISFKPTIKEHFNITLWSIILPLGVYLLLLNVNFLSGRYYSVTYNYFTFGMQKWLLIMLCVLPSCWVIRRFVRKKCSEQNIEIVSQNRFFITNISLLGVFLLFASTPFMMKILDITTVTEMKDALRLVTMVLKIYSLCLIAWWLLYCMDLKKKFTQYKRLYWINLMPYFAVSVTSVFLLVFFINILQVEYFFQKDEYILTKNLNYEMTKVETDTVEKTKDFIANKLLNN